MSAPAAASGIDRSTCPARRHTASSARSYGCTCPDAHEAARIYKKRQRHGLLRPGYVPGHGVQRRIRAMQAAGHGLAELAAHLGCTHQNVSQLAIAHDRGRSVHRDTDARVQALYARLRDVPGTSTEAATKAARRGWARPEHWDGVDIDDPTAESDLAFRRTDDGPTAADLLDLMSPERGGLDVERIAERYGLDPAEVERRVQHARITLAKSRLADDDALDIRDRWRAARAAGRPDLRHDLAAEYGITAATVLDILTGRARPHLRLPDLIGDSPYRRSGARSRIPA